MKTYEPNQIIHLVKESNGLPHTLLSPLLDLFQIPLPLPLNLVHLQPSDLFVIGGLGGRGGGVGGDPGRTSKADEFGCGESDSGGRAGGGDV